MLSKIANSADSKDRKTELVKEYYNNTFTTHERGSLGNRVKQLVTDNSPIRESTAASRINEQILEALK